MITLVLFFKKLSKSFYWKVKVLKNLVCLLNLLCISNLSKDTDNEGATFLFQKAEQKLDRPLNEPNEIRPN